MSCETCSQMRLDWLNAMIALDVKRVAALTAQALQHIVAPKPNKDGTDGTV